jgi:hypothetical protein
MASNGPSSESASTRLVAGIVLVSGCTGVVLAFVGFVSTLLARRRVWPASVLAWAIAAADAVVIVIALSVARPG